MNSFKTFLREVNLSWSFHKFPEIMTDLIDETKRDKCPLATSYIIKKRLLCSSKYLDTTMQILSSSIFSLINMFQCVLNISHEFQ